MGRIKATNGQRDQLRKCNPGVGIMVYHKGNGVTVEIEFYLNKNNIPCMLQTGNPIEFEVDEDDI